MIVEGLLTDFIAVVKRLHALSPEQQDDFYDQLGFACNKDAELDSALQELAEYFVDGDE